jgi:hypothetical protein
MTIDPISDEDPSLPGKGARSAPAPTRPRGRDRNTQKTFYTDRIFVLYEPQDFRQYLRKLVELETSSNIRTSWDELEAMVGLDAWATVLIHRSRLLLWDFRRFVFGLFKNGYFKGDLYPVNPLGSPTERQDITMQLAIEAIANRSDVRARIDENPYYARLIYDTLYYASTVHPNAIDFDALKAMPAFPAAGDDLQLANVGYRRFTSESLRNHLIAMAETSRDQMGPEPGIRDPDDFLGKGILFRYLADYLKLLSDPEQIRNSTIAAATQLKEPLIKSA